jgi:hypothetical protein
VNGLTLRRADVLELVTDELFPRWSQERDRLDRIDRWYRFDHEDIKLPRRATTELKVLAELSKIPWLGLVVGSVAQCMYVDGYRSPLDATRTEPESTGPWRTWQANAMDRRQVAVHRAALAYGYAYVTVLPGEDDDGKRSVLRGASPRKMFAAYGDVADDDWPMYAIRVETAPDKNHLVRLIDDTDIHYVTVPNTGGKAEYITAETHGADVCPVVRYANSLDLEGRSPGEVEPFIPAAARINKTSFDRMVTQHFSSWKVRTVSGMAEPDDEETANRQKLQLRQDDILIAEDADTKFGSLDESPLDGFIAAWRSDVEALAAVSQTPTHMLTGQLINLSAEALAAARAGLTQKVAERQRAFGASHAQALRLAAALEGNADDARDVMGRVTWQDMEIRSMSQAVDALGKAATMLHIPVQALWGRVPGVEKSDVDEWALMAADADPMIRLTDELARQGEGLP